MEAVQNPQWGIVLRPWPDEPVFHRFDEMRRVGYGWVDYTRCGREIGGSTPWLPFKHVIKFGRPCKGCFPEGV